MAIEPPDTGAPRYEVDRRPTLIAGGVASDRPIALDRDGLRIPAASGGSFPPAIRSVVTATWWSCRRSQRSGDARRAPFVRPGIPIGSIAACCDHSRRARWRSSSPPRSAMSSLVRSSAVPPSKRSQVHRRSLCRDDRRGITGGSAIADLNTDRRGPPVAHRATARARLQRQDRSLGWTDRCAARLVDRRH